MKLLYSLLFFLSFSTFATYAQTSFLLNFSVSKGTSVSDTLGSNLSSYDALYTITSDQKWSGWCKSGVTSCAGMIPLTTIDPKNGYFASLNQNITIPAATNRSGNSLNITTGLHLFNFNSTDTLQSVTASSLATRLFAIFGMDNNKWHVYLHNPSQALLNIFGPALQNQSIAPLTTLTSNRSYFVGITPLGKKVSINSVRLPGTMKSTPIHFGASIPSSGSLSTPFAALGRTTLTSSGEWSGDVYIPNSYTKAVAHLKGDQSSTFKDNDFSSKNLFSIFDTSQTTLPQLNISPFTSLLAISSSQKPQKPLSHSINSFLAPLVTKADNNILDREIFNLLNTSLHNNNYKGAYASEKETTPFNLLHQIANQTIELMQNNSIATIDEFRRNLRVPQATSSSSLNNLFNNFFTTIKGSGLNTLITEFNTRSGFTWQANPQLAITDSYSIYNQNISIGKHLFHISKIENNTATLEPDISGVSVYNNFPTSMNFPLNFFASKGNKVTTTVLRIEEVGKESTHYAQVILRGAKISFKDHNRVEFDFPITQTNNFLNAGGYSTTIVDAVADDNISASSTNKTHDNKDWFLGNEDALPVPIQQYLDKVGSSTKISNFTGNNTDGSQKLLKIFLEFKDISLNLHNNPNATFNRIEVSNLHVE
jgi:hypothetical protein